MSANAVNASSTSDKSTADYCFWLVRADTPGRKYLCITERNGVPSVERAPDAETATGADAGDPKAMLRMGNAALSNGDGKAAIDWLSKAASRNLPAAMCELGDIYRNGVLAEKNSENALHWYLAAHGQGFWVATYQLASMYEVGEGVVQDRVKAARLFKQAAASGDLDALTATSAP